MSKRNRKRSSRVRESVTAVCHAAGAASKWIARHLPRRRIRVEVVIVDQARRKALQRQLSVGLRQLQWLFGDQPPTDVAVLVQQVIPLDRQMAGCCQVTTRADGRRLALIRLALEVNGRRLSADEVLAALAEQCLGLAQQDAQTTAVVPVDLDPGSPPAQHRPADLPPDPLGPYVTRYAGSAVDREAA